MPFTLLDGILVLVMLVSAVLAMIRGFTREVFSIGSWVAAAAVTYFFWEDVLPYTQGYIDDKTVSLGVTIAGALLPDPAGGFADHDAHLRFRIGLKGRAA
jgi:membrane protein required for colicin V production